MRTCGQYFSNEAIDSNELIWVDIGGGTGSNIEFMNRYKPIHEFKQIHLVDLSPSLCEIAKARFDALGWDNVTVHCMDASQFLLNQKVDLVTMSYSLTMMETYFKIIDQISASLSSRGIIGVVDFFSAPNRSNDPTRYQSFGMRTFWRIWFNVDNVYLDPDRRFYMEHKFKTCFVLNCAHDYIKPLIKVPYFVYIGTLPNSNVSSKQFHEFQGIIKRQKQGELDETHSVGSDEE